MLKKLRGPHLLPWTCVFLLGVIFPTTWSCLPPQWFSILVAIASCAIVQLCPNKYKKWGTIVAALLLGIAWCCYRGNSIRLSLPEKYLNIPIITTGRIVSFPEKQPGRVRFEYLIDKIDDKPCQTKKVLLTEYSYTSPPILSSLKRGEYWQLPVRIKKPRGFWNPGSFDYQAWLLQRGIVATGTVVKSSKLPPPLKRMNSLRIQTPIDIIINHLNQFRIQLNARIFTTISDHKYLGLLQALVTGMRDRISPHQWEVMRATGTNHLFSISGLHIGFIGGIIYRLALFLWSYTRLSLWIPAQQVAYLSAWLGALGYSVISGFALPIQRAIIMFSLFTFTLLRRRVFSAWQGWCIALLMMLFMNPFIVLSESFWLSFGAVAIIFYGLGSRLKLRTEITYWKKLWIGWGHTQWVVSIGLMPATLWFFQQVSILGFLANLIAIPLIGFVVLPFSLWGTLFYPIWPQGMGMLIRIGDQALEYLWGFLTYIAAMPSSYYFFTIPNRWVLLSTHLSVLLFITPKGFPSRYYLASIGLLPLFLWKPAVPQPGEFWLTVLDVGQGLAAIVRTHKHILIYDTGPRFSVNLNAGSAVVMPYLRTLRVRNINTLIVSHGDNDHSGGVQSILNSATVNSILASELERLRVNDACLCQKGQSWEWDGVKFSLLHPPAQHGLKSNDASCVLKVSTKQHQLLLPGDIHRKGEKVLLENNPDLNAITLLVAPHHGSKTSSSIALIKRILPQYVLFPVGYQNRFKFPHTPIVNRYMQYQSKLYSTAQEGAITVKFNPSRCQPTIESFYEKHRRFWHL